MSHDHQSLKQGTNLSALILSLNCIVSYHLKTYIFFCIIHNMHAFRADEFYHK